MAQMFLMAGMRRPARIKDKVDDKSFVHTEPSFIHFLKPS